MRAEPVEKMNALTDAQLAGLVKKGDRDAFSVLSDRYLPLLRARAGRYSSIVGAETEDFFQEGMLALFRAAKAYDSGEQAMFRTYAITCVNNSMSSAIKLYFKQARATRVFDVEPVSDNPVEETFFHREETNERALRINSLLSDFERQILRLYLGGHSYQQISKVLGTSTKSVDNALQRVRRKLRPQLKDPAAATSVHQPNGC